MGISEILFPLRLLVLGDNSGKAQISDQILDDHFVRVLNMTKLVEIGSGIGERIVEFAGFKDLSVFLLLGHPVGYYR